MAKFGLLAALLLPLALAGCVTRAAADARARAAYQAGQRDAMRLLQQQQPQTPSVRIDGPVRTPVLPWTPDLTVSKALVNAGYEGAGDPRDILVVHQGVARRVDVQGLLRGQDVPLEPGDIVHIVAQPQGFAPPPR
jgi:hypothetical protein